MAKRTEERPFRPLDAGLVQAVMSGNAAVSTTQTPAPREEPVRAVEPVRTEEPPTQIRNEQGREPQPVVHRAPFQAEAPRRAVRHEAAKPSLSQLAERMEREKRVLLTASEERALERVVANIGAELGTSLKLSHVLRSCIRLVIAAEGDLVERARATGRIVRPPNGDLAAIEGFEKVVAAVLQAGIRSSRPIR